ncbi:MAG: ABC transporter permease [Clostridia bacterium]|nr:ABC transporter permease [Clostridia bacterium]
MKDRLIYDAKVMGQLTARNFKIFIKDKMLVFMSLLAPLIVLMLYVLFLGDTQKDSIINMLPAGVIDTKVINAFVNGWMLAGVMSVSCITVALSASTIMVADKEKGIINDYVAAPVPKALVKLSYLLSTFIISTFICLMVELIGLIYVAATGWYLSVSDVFAILGITILSTFSSSILMNLILTPFKTSNSVGAFTGIISAAIGFLMGAYIPLPMLGKGVEYFACFIPGTYSAGVFRDLYMGGVLDYARDYLPEAAIDELASGYSVKVNFFGKAINPEISAVILAAITAVILLIWLFAPMLISSIKDKLKSKK